MNEHNNQDKMLKNFIKNLIITTLGNYVEVSDKYIQRLFLPLQDFTAHDIVIDQWNGRIAKENVKFKKDAFRSLLGSMLGAPIEIVQGYAKQLLIEVPWSKILSKPVEIKVEDVHVILKSRGSYDRQFIKERIIADKQAKIEELLNHIKDQLTTDLQQAAAQEANQSYLSRLGDMITENLRINVRNVHIRFEDTKVSRNDQAFNFGLMAESIQYSMTNNRFQRAFLNIDDKIQEQKSFSMLQITKLAMYWNSNAQENWTKNSEFNTLTAQGTINFSKRYTENLMRSRQEGVFIIQPCDIAIKFRSNLAPNERPEIPTSTTAMDISDITVSMDQDVYKDIQYLGKFFSWHAVSKQKTAYLKYRPSYTTSVRGNVQAYWRYAIKATIYLIRKERIDRAALKRKRHDEMIQLAEIYKLEKVNAYFKETGVKDLLLTLGPNVPTLNGIKTYRSEKKLERRRFHLEYKLTPEQIVAALTKADKESKLYIQEYQKKSSLKGWVTSMFSFRKSEETKADDPLDIELQKQLDKIVEKSEQMRTSAENETQETSTHDGAKKPENKQVSSHFSLSIPLIELLFVNKQSYTSKCFMRIALQDFFLQTVSYADGQSLKLYSLRSFQILDKLEINEKFQKAIYMTPCRTTQAEVKADAKEESKVTTFDEMLTINEIEEEDRPFINNGLPKIRTFQESLVNGGEHFVVFSVLQAPQVSRDGLIDKIKVDLFVNHTTVFYNRLLLSQAETFFHQATLNKVQNATAEDDFELQKQQLFQKTETQLNEILRRSQFEVSCTLQGIDVLVPDDTNYELSKFLLLQTGNVILRSKPQDPDRIETTMDPYFSSVLDTTVLQLTNRPRQIKSDEVGPRQLTENQMSIVKRLQRKTQSHWDDYAIHAYDFRVLYVPTAKELETGLLNATAVSKEPVQDKKNQNNQKNNFERQHWILKRTDIQADFSKYSKQSADDQTSVVKASISVNSFELRFTNKEVKELKYFADKFQKYHEELRNQVFQTYVKLAKENQQMIKKVHSLPALKLPSAASSSLGINISAVDVMSSRSTQNLLAKSQRILRRRTLSRDSNVSGVSSDDFQDARDHFSDARSSISKIKPAESRGNSDDEDDDEGFYDAQDFFDPEILNLLMLDKNMETITEEVKTNNPESQVAPKSTLCFFTQLQVSKISIEVLEAQDFQSELVKNIRSVMRQGTEERQQSQQWKQLKNEVKTLDEKLKSKMRQKGAPFLNFEVSKLSASLLHLPQVDEQSAVTYLACLVVRDICLSDMQHATPQVIFRSANHIVDDHSVHLEASDFRKTSFDSVNRNSETLRKKSAHAHHGGRLFDIEDEDNMLDDHNDHLQETFVSFSLLSQEGRLVVDAESDEEDEAEEKKVNFSVLAMKLQLGLIEAEITDYTIKRVIDQLVTDFPMSTGRQRADDAKSKDKSYKLDESDNLDRVFTDLMFVSDGLHCRLRTQAAEISHCKIVGLKAQTGIAKGKTTSTLGLEDFQILHNENELIFRHNFATSSQEAMMQTSDLSNKKQRVNFFENGQEEKDYDLVDQPNQILTIHLEETQQTKTISCTITNLLVIPDLQASTKIIKNISGLVVAIGPIKTKPSLVNQPDFEIEKDLQLHFKVFGFHIQIPVSRDSKNYLFLSLDQFVTDVNQYATVTNERTEPKDQQFKISCQGLECFVAKQIDQACKYYLFQVLDANLQASLPPEEPSVPKEVIFSIGKVQLNLNDNFLLLLASLVEFHMPDVVNIQTAVTNFVGLLKATQVQMSTKEQKSARKLKSSESQVTSKITLSRKTLRHHAKNSPFLKSVIAQEKILNDEALNIRTYLRGQVSCVQIQWLFEMSFDDHDENFQTLNNRNFSKQVLSRLETKQETLIMPSFSFAPLLDEAKTNRASVKQALDQSQYDKKQSFANHKRIAFTLHNLMVETAQNNADNNQYFNLTVATGILDHHQMQINTGTKHHAGTTYVCPFDPSIVSEFPILIFRSSTNEGCLEKSSKEQASEQQKAHTRFQDKQQKEPDAIAVASAFQKTQATISLVDLRVCQMNVKVVANLVTSAYSCKNLLAHGHKRHLFRNVLKGMSSGSNLPVRTPQKQLDYVMSLKKVRLICFDSQSHDAKPKSKSFNRDSLTRTLLDYESSDFQFKPHSLLIIESAFHLNNSKPQQELPDFHAENAFAAAAPYEGLQADSHMNLRAGSVEIYMNSARTNLIDLMAPGSKSRAVILYPTEVSVHSQFFSKRNLRVNDVQISMVEFETSFRQLFSLSLLMTKLTSELEPIKQIFERINSSVGTKERAGIQRKHKGLRSNRRNDQSSDQPTQPNQSSQETQRGVMIVAVKVQSIYVALIREASMLPVAGTKSHHMQPNEMSCMPLLSLEVKWVKIESKSQVTGVQQTDIQLPFELYYFNQKLAFFEPVVEKVMIKASVDSETYGSSEQRILIENVLNINLSVALYESLFLLSENYQEELKQYERVKSKGDNNDHGPDSVDKPELLRQKTETFDQIVYSTSTSFIRNKTGEMLLFKAGRQPAFTEMKNNETLPLDFNSQPLQQPEPKTTLLSVETGSKGFFDGLASEDMQPSSEAVSYDDEDSDDLDGFEPENQHLWTDDQKTFKAQATRSMYRRDKFRLKTQEPNIVLLQVLIQRGKDVVRTESFEINFNLLSCQAVFLDETRRLYVICQIQNKDGQKILVVRSPMQVTNNLQIPIEVQLCIPSFVQTEEGGKNDNSVTLSKDAAQPVEARKFFPHPMIGIEALQWQESFKKGLLLQKQDAVAEYSVVVKAESSVIIPLKACTFESVRIRPLYKELWFSKDASMFDWSSKAPISLLREESDIFKTEPIVLSSTLAEKKVQDATEPWKQKQKPPASKDNNSVFFALNANTCPLRSFIDFNTQKTTFISLRYLSITSPFVFQNLIPVPITMHFKNVDQELEKPQAKHFEMTLKHNSSLQVLYLNPKSNFEFSLAIPGYKHSRFVGFQEDEEKGEDTDEVKLKNISKPEMDEQLDPEAFESANEKSQLAHKAPFRFLKQRKLLFEMESQFQNQFNICGNIAQIQGFFQISFYSKFWLLNNTQMPLQFKVEDNLQSFPPLDLPFESNEFDFETVKHFDSTDQTPGKDSKNEKTMQRKDSNDTLRESNLNETFTDEQDNKTIITCTELDTEKQDRVDQRHIISMVGANKDCEGHEKNEKDILLRLKPWESYKAQGRENQGLLGALTQEDIARISSIYFTQEMLEEESKEEIQELQSSKAKSHADLIKSNRTVSESESPYIMAAPGTLRQHVLPSLPNLHEMSVKKRTVHFEEDLPEPSVSLQSSAFNQGMGRAMHDSLRVDKQFDKRSMTSKTSIQLQSFAKYQDQTVPQPLNVLNVSKIELYDSPLHDKDQLKRIILFSNSEDSLDNSKLTQPYNDQQNYLLSNHQTLRLKICDSQWAKIPFDLARLHTGPIKIFDKEHAPGSVRPRAMFELVAVVTFLPSPYSFSKLICFQPRYLMVNRTFRTIQVAQVNCEDLGTFKIFPQETSVFHWTDSEKQQLICVKMEDHAFSGSIQIDRLGEWNFRLRSTYRMNDNTILNVSIREESNSLYIVFTDISHAPPYRIENLTKSKFNIAQTGSRRDDFDALEPYTTLSFAWSQPLAKQKLKISLCRLQTDEDLGDFYLDSIQEREIIKIKDGERKDFVLEITSEKTIKVLKIMYPYMINAEKAPDAESHANQDNFNYQFTKIVIERLGISVVNSQPRELAYTTISNLRVTYESTVKHQSLSLKVGDLQMDNMVSRQYDAILIQRQERDKNHGDFFRLKYNLQKHQAIENLIVFKYLTIEIVPIQLMIDGNWCDEVFLYSKDVVQLIQRHTLRKKHLEATSYGFIDHQNILLQTNKLRTPELGKGIALSKKGQPIVEQRDTQKIYIENFYISDISVVITFAKTPLVFREITLPPLLQYLISWLSRMSKIQLGFKKYIVQNEQMLVSVFIARLNQFYNQEIMNHKSLINLISQMSIKDQLIATVAVLWQFVKSLNVMKGLLGGQEEEREESMLSALFLDSVFYVKDYFQDVAGTLFSSIATLKTGEEPIEIEGAEEVIDDDNISKIATTTSPLAGIETQNQLWLKVITREVYLETKQRKTKDQEKRKHGSRKVLDLKEKKGPIRIMTKSAVMSVAELRQEIKDAYSGVVTTFIMGEDRHTGQLQKVRPTRYFGFRRELEPYDKKKAFVLQILNDINLNVYEAEAIQKMYNLNNHTVIITGKRIICVDEQKFLGKDSIQATLAQRRSQAQKAVYRHWNIMFKDIYSISLDIINHRTGRKITKFELEQAVYRDHADDQLQTKSPEQSVHAGQVPKQVKAVNDETEKEDELLLESKLQFVLRIYYQGGLAEEMVDDDLMSARDTTKRKPTEAKKPNYALLQQRQTKGGLLDGLSGLMVGCKDISAKIKDFKIIKRISRDIEEKRAVLEDREKNRVEDDISSQVGLI